MPFEIYNHGKCSDSKFETNGTLRSYMTRHLRVGSTIRTSPLDLVFK